MSSPAFTQAVSAALERTGLTPKPGWLAIELAKPSYNRPSAVLSDADVRRAANAVLMAVLNQDLRDCALPRLPPSFGALHAVRVPGPLLLQVDELVNVGASAAEEQRPQDRRRMLKLALTDGSALVPALEVAYIPDLACPGTRAGCKIVVRDAAVRRGLLLLRPENVAVLGGGVAELAALQAFVAEQLAASRRPMEAAKEALLPPAGLNIAPGAGAMSLDDDVDSAGAGEASGLRASLAGITRAASVTGTHSAADAPDTGDGAGAGAEDGRASVAASDDGVAPLGAGYGQEGDEDEEEGEGALAHDSAIEVVSDEDDEEAEAKGEQAAQAERAAGRGQCGGSHAPLGAGAGVSHAGAGGGRAGGALPPARMDGMDVASEWEEDEREEVGSCGAATSSAGRGRRRLGHGTSHMQLGDDDCGSEGDTGGALLGGCGRSAGQQPQASSAAAAAGVLSPHVTLRKGRRQRAGAGPEQVAGRPGTGPLALGCSQQAAAHGAPVLHGAAAYAGAAGSSSGRAGSIDLDGDGAGDAGSEAGDTSGAGGCDDAGGPGAGAGEGVTDLEGSDEEAEASASASAASAGTGKPVKPLPVRVWTLPELLPLLPPLLAGGSSMSSSASPLLGAPFWLYAKASRAFVQPAGAAAGSAAAGGSGSQPLLPSTPVPRMILCLVHEEAPGPSPAAGSAGGGSTVQELRAEVGGGWVERQTGGRSLEGIMAAARSPDVHPAAKADARRAAANLVSAASRTAYFRCRWRGGGVEGPGVVVMLDLTEEAPTQPA